MPGSTQIPQLLGALHAAAAWEDETGARQHAEAIAQLGGEPAVNALIGVLERMSAVDLSDDAGDNSDECFRASHAALHGLVLLGQAAVPRLLATLSGPPSRARGYAAHALATLGEPKALAPLLTLATADDDEENNRFDALEALGRLGLPEALPILRAAATPTNPPGNENVRTTAAVAIGALHHPESCAILRSLLTDPSWSMRYHVCEALENLGTTDARTVLETAVHDTDERVAGRARAALLNATAADPDRR